MRSIENRGNICRPISTALRACLAVWCRPKNFRWWSFKDWTPRESRFIPAVQKSRNFELSEDPGLASRVISAFSWICHFLLIALIMFPTIIGSINDGVPPPKNILDISLWPSQLAPFAISVSSAMLHSEEVMLRSTWLLKSQYGHLDVQNGQWI